MCSGNTHASQAKIKQEPRTRASLQEQEGDLKNKNQEPTTNTNTQDLPCFGALEEGNTPTAALAYPLIIN